MLRGFLETAEDLTDHRLQRTRSAAMMGVDAALAAVFLRETDAPRVLRALEQVRYACMSAANFLEIAIIIDHRDAPEQMVDHDLFLTEGGVEIIPVTAAQARIARGAYNRFGKGNHPAGLSFGDCFAYALAKERELPLLCKGAAFAQTDVTPAVS